ncbi:MAG: ribosome small subunit-dependent GTPase A [Bacteroidia bacterium]|nr:ribosome small subunit-dependent GTPase A [Bacteroidia bacterium]
MKGRVLKSTGTWLQVESENGALIACRVRGNMRLRGIDSTNPMAVGDLIHFELEDDGTGVISDFEPRKNYIIRKSVNLSKQTQILAANIDMLWLVVTPALPKTSTGFIDRFIAAAESFRIPSALILNKSDLFTGELEAVQQEIIDIYEPLGYPCYKVSALQGDGLDELKAAFKGKVNLLSGHSGVGKSSLINALAPGLNLKTGDISRQHLKGKHTTTFAEMHQLPFGAYLIDTPGIREFVNIDFKPAEIGHYFVEIRVRMQDCKFNNCLHDTEKECAVKKAVEAGEIHRERYYNYISMLRNEDIYK